MTELQKILLGLGVLILTGISWLAVLAEIKRHEKEVLAEEKNRHIGGSGGSGGMLGGPGGDYSYEIEYIHSQEETDRSISPTHTSPILALPNKVAYSGDKISSDDFNYIREYVSNKEEIDKAAKAVLKKTAKKVTKKGKKSPKPLKKFKKINKKSK